MTQRSRSTTRKLEGCFQELARALPSNETKSFVFTAETFTEFPSTLETDQILVRKERVNYDDFSADRLQFFASKSAYRELGLLILSVVFRRRGSQVRVVLTQPSSHIKNLITEYSGTTARVSGHHTIPDKYVFCPERVATHPWTGQSQEVLGFPKFTLTNMKRFVVTEQDWTSRDTVVGFGNDDASVRLAGLLLNLGSPENETTEVVLEGEGGFRGVSVHSAEAAFYLPGSLAWPDGVDLSSLF